MRTIEQLEAALAAATPGEVITDAQMVVLKDRPAYIVCDCMDSLKTLKQEMADARLIALMKNTLPALIECAKVLDAIAQTCWEGSIVLPDNRLVKARAALTELEQDHESQTV